MRPTRERFILVVGVVIGVAACGGKASSPGADVPIDTPEDVPVSPDVPVDAPTDKGQDTPLDVAPDPGVDLGTDQGKDPATDGSTDVLADLPGDVSPQCDNDEDCDDGLFCTGPEACQAGTCVPGTPPCAPTMFCNEDGDRCDECGADADCDDELFCNGLETCVAGACVPGTAPCKPEELCREESDKCVALNPYRDTLSHHFVHDLSAGGHHDQKCLACHHDDPPAAGQACTDCHHQAEGLWNSQHGAFAAKLKEVMHTDVGAGGRKGCRSCHNKSTPDGAWDCSQCHLDF